MQSSLGFGRIKFSLAKTLDKKISFILLSLLVTFDDLFSYIAIVYWGKHEAHPLSRYFIEISPLFYFVFIPITLLGFYLITKVAGWLAVRTRKVINLGKREIYERIILTTILIAWGVGNTSWNFGYLLLGRSSFPFDWRILEAIGVGLALVYAFYMSRQAAGFERARE